MNNLIVNPEDKNRGVVTVNPVAPVTINSVEKIEPSPLMLWLVFISTWILSFLIQQDFYFSVEGDAGFTVEKFADAVTEGSLLRRVALPMLAAIGMFCLIRYGRQRLCMRGFIGWVLLAFFLWMVASVLWSEYPELTIRRLVAFGCFLICTFGLATFPLKYLPLYAAMFCGFNLMVGVFAELSLGTFHPAISGYRFSGTWHPNSQGLNLSILILACNELRVTDGVKQRLLAVGGILIASLFLLLTQSRTSIGAVGATLLLNFIIMAVRTHGLRCLALPITTLSLLASLLLTINIVNPESSLSNMAGRTIETKRDSGDPTSLTGRVDLWETVIDYAAKQPILGYGYDTFWSANRIEEISRIQDWPVQEAHNAYLEWLVNLGMVGLGLYTIVMLYAWIMCLRKFIKENNVYGFASNVFLFIMLHNCLESSNAQPVFSSFLAFIVLFDIGFFNPLATK